MFATKDTILTLLEQAGIAPIDTAKKLGFSSLQTEVFKAICGVGMPPVNDDDLTRASNLRSYPRKRITLARDEILTALRRAALAARKP